MKKIRSLLGTLAAKGMLALAVSCQAQTTDISSLVVQDASRSFLEDPALVKFSSSLCAELVHTLPYGAQLGTVDVTSEKVIPTSWQTLTNRRQASGDCYQKSKKVKTLEVNTSEVKPGTFSCLGGDAALEMINKAKERRVLTVLHIPANELEEQTCPDVWQSLGKSSGQMVVVLSQHHQGQQLNEQLYEALKEQTNVNFCAPNQALDCVTEAVELLKHQQEQGSHS